MSKELKCCPFCGGKARFRIYDLKGYRGNYEYIIRCDNCNIQFKEDDVYQSKIKARQKVIDKWNTRNPIDRIVAELEQSTNNLTYNDSKFGRMTLDIPMVQLETCKEIIRKGGAE